MVRAPRTAALNKPSALVIVLTGTASVAISLGFGRFTYSLLLPAMTTDLIGSYARAGTLGTINLGAYLVGIVGVSLLVPRRSPITLLQLGLAGTSLGLAILSIAPGYWVLVVGMIVAGFCSASVWVPVTALVSSVVSTARRGLALGAVVAGPGVGILLAGQLTAVIRGMRDPDIWREVWAVQAALALLVLIVAALVLRRMTWSQTPHPGFALSFLRRVPGWLPLTVAYAAFGLGYTMYATFVVTALESDAGFSASHAATTYSALGVTSIAGGMAMGRLSDAIGRRPVLNLAFVVLTGCCLLTLTHTEPWPTLSAALFGLMLTGVGAVVSAYIGDHLEGAAVGAAFGAVTVTFGVMQMAGPHVGGWLADRAGAFTQTFLLAATAFVLAGIASWALPRTRRTAESASK